MAGLRRQDRAGAKPVTVLLSVYNCERFLPETLRSLSAQTFEEFDLIAVNDGSNDRTGEILERQKDTRIRVIHNERNLGLPAALNRGLREVRSALVARADGDDVYEPERLEAQVEFMRQHPEVGVASSHIRYVSENGAHMTDVRLPIADEDIRFRMLWSCALAHPAAIYRTDLVRRAGAYNPKFSRCEDYELWSRLALVTRFANVDRFLARIRLRRGSITTQVRMEDFRQAAEISKRLLDDYLGDLVPLDDVIAFRLLAYPVFAVPGDLVASGLALMERVIEQAAQRESDRCIASFRSALGQNLLLQSTYVSHDSPTASLRLLSHALKLNPKLTRKRLFYDQVVRLGIKVPLRRLLPDIGARRFRTGSAGADP